MSLQFVGEGLVIHRQGAILEFVNRAGKVLWFQDTKTGDFIDIEEEQFHTEQVRQDLLVLDTLATKTRLIYPEEEIQGSGPLAGQPLPISTLSPHVQMKYDRRLNYVLGIRKLGISRGCRLLLADAAKRIALELGEAIEDAPSPATLNRWLSAYEKNRCEAHVLIPRYAQRKPAVLSEPENEALIEKAIQTKIFDEGALKDSQVCIEYKRLLLAENRKRQTVNLPPIVEYSASTIRRRISSKPAYDVCVARMGKRQARHTFRMAKGELPSDYPLQVAEIDHTQIDWWVVDDQMMLPLGLPWLTVIRDRYAGVILGIFITFRKTGLDSIFGALRHSFYAHAKVQEIWPDIENPWLSCGFATLYVSDRGSDFLSPRYRLGIRQLGADVEYSERETPWHKAPVERCGKYFHDLFETLPGHTFPFLHAPRGYVAKKHAVVRFSTACYIIHKWICDIYHVTPHSRKQASPLERWNEGLAHMPPPLPPSPESLDVLVGEVYRGRLSHEGIRHQWLSYANPRLEALQKRIGTGKMLDFIPHTREMGYIHVIDPSTKEPFRVECRQSKYANGITQFQHEYLRRVAGAGLNASNVEGRLLAAQQQVQDEIANALEHSANPGKLNLWKAARRAGINSNDTLDGTPRSIATITGQSNETVIAESQQPEMPPGFSPQVVGNIFTDVPRYNWGAGRC